MISETRTSILTMLLALLFLLSPNTFAEAPKFEAYPAAIFTEVRVSEVDLQSHPDAPVFRTRLQDALEQDSRFAGHYAFATLGVRFRLSDVNDC